MGCTKGKRFILNLVEQLLGEQRPCLRKMADHFPAIREHLANHRIYRQEGEDKLFFAKQGRIGSTSKFNKKGGHFAMPACVKSTC